MKIGVNLAVKVTVLAVKNASFRQVGIHLCIVVEGEAWTTFLAALEKVTC